MVQVGYSFAFIIALDYLCGLQSTLKFELWQDTRPLDLVRIRWAVSNQCAFFVTFSTICLRLGGSRQPFASRHGFINRQSNLGMFYYLAQVHETCDPTRFC